MCHRISTVVAFTLCLLTRASEARGGTPRLDTVAEKSNFTATSRHADVLDFCAKLAKLSPRVVCTDMGTSHEGRKLPLLIIADPPVRTPEEAAKSGKLVVFAMANIHAGEVDGKEGLLMLARDLALSKDAPLLRDLVILLAPNFNPDGGDRFGKHRPWQAGPDEVGTRQNAEGFDLNRDFVKAETAEVRALLRLLRHWDPAILIDCHTTNGTYTRYALTYAGPKHPSNHAPLVAFSDDTMLPEASRRLEKATGFKSFLYGNLTRDDKTWKSIEAVPRYGFLYFGFRNRVGILSESYVYASYRDRVTASREFVRGVFETAAAHKKRLQALCREADDAAKSAAPGTRVALRHKLVSLPEPATILGLSGGKTMETGKARDVRADVVARPEPTLTVARPYAYFVPPSFAKAVETLQRHGIRVEKLREATTLDVEVHRIDKLTRAKPFQKHALVTVDATARKENRNVPAGTIVVRTDQPLGNLAAFLLEPQSEDGLCTWNFFDEGLAEGKDYAVLRVPAPTRLATEAVPALAEDGRQ